METTEHVAAIIAVLEAAGLTVGDHARPWSIPADPSEGTWEPYVTVHLQPGGSVNGSAADPDSDFDVRFALMSVGRLASEATDTADAAHVAITAGFTVAGRSIQRVQPIEPAGPVLPDYDTTPPLFSATRRYGFFSFPS